MNRKGKIIMIGLAAVLALGGCGARMPEMTDEQAHKIGEYAAITLLKFDANSRSRLVDPAMIEILESEEKLPVVTTPPPEPEPEEPEPTVPEAPVIEIGQETPEPQSLEEFLGLADGMTVRYVGEEICQSYPADGSDFFALEATTGKQLLVLNFQISNQSGAAQTLDLLGRHDQYRITVNDSYTRNALTTLLTNDMTTYQGSIASGESRGVVLLIEIDLQQTGMPSTIVLSLKNDSETCKIQLM